jgi:serine/threonine protein phosphatase 1
MISRFLKRKPKLTLPSNPAVPEGVAVWAIGDVHGRMDLLKPLVDAILTDAAEMVAERKIVIFLGDYIDRGPDSRGVVQYLARLATNKDVDWRFLKGNHEEAMIRFLLNGSGGSQWCEYGGDATLHSYGLRAPDMRHKPEAWAHLAADLSHRLTDPERNFLKNLELSVTFGDYFFAHAGARPGVPLDQQTPEDVMWIRRTFLESDVAFERVVVHGHTPTAQVHSDRRRVGIDTKAYSSGRLTALRLIGAERSIVEASLSPLTGQDSGAEELVVIDRRPLV